MLTCHLMGGLGNQLFQIFTTISYAIKSNNKFHFLNVDTLEGCTLRYTYWNSFLVRLKPFLKEQFPKLTRVRERGFNFNEIEIEPGKDICLFGYFQSYKYFEDNFKTISKMIGIDAFKVQVIEKCQLEVQDYISIHFRIGDYKKVSLVHPIATYEYYKSALTYIQSIDDTKNKVLFFCEDEDIESVNQTVNALRNDFPSVVFVRADPKLTDWEQMLLMSSCSHNIIANSSFSWWGAYLNANPDKQVCYPSAWFGVGGHDTRDLCPLTWIYF